MVIEKRKGMKASVVLAAMVVVIAVALVPIATAQERVTLDITPDTGIAGAIAAYSVEVIAEPGYSECMIINVTLPAGFGAVEPTDNGVLIATVTLYDVTGGWFAYATFKSNNSDPTKDQMDVSLHPASGSPASKTIEVYYSPGGETSVDASYLKGHAKLPTETENGYLNGTVTPPDGVELTKVIIDIEKFVQNPTEEGLYPFNACARPCEGGDREWGNATIHIRSPAALPALTPIGLIALVGLLSVVLVGAAVRRKK